MHHKKKLTKKKVAKISSLILELAEEK